ncbi:hypothetical protein CDIK_2261 [Cucumispora dikerogammari]|nr:hypothetical protein CDIK_2261 [Cucumispora dikerogammari]
MLMFSLPVYFHTNSVFVANTGVLDTCFASEKRDKEKNKSFLNNHLKEKTVYYCNTTSNDGNIQDKGVIRNPSLVCTDGPLNLGFYRERTVDCVNSPSDLRSDTSLVNTSELLGIYNKNYEKNTDIHSVYLHSNHSLGCSRVGGQYGFIREPSSASCIIKPNSISEKRHATSLISSSNQTNRTDMAGIEKKFDVSCNEPQKAQALHFYNNMLNKKNEKHELKQKVSAKEGFPSESSTGFRPGSNTRTSYVIHKEFLHKKYHESLFSDHEYLSNAEIKAKSKKDRKAPYSINPIRTHKDVGPLSANSFLSTELSSKIKEDQSECKVISTHVVSSKEASFSVKEKIFPPVAIEKNLSVSDIRKNDKIKVLYKQIFFDKEKYSETKLCNSLHTFYDSTPYIEIFHFFSNNDGHFDIGFYIYNIPRFFDIIVPECRSGFEIRENKNCPFRNGSFYRLVKIDVKGTLPQNTQLLDILPTFKLTSYGDFFNKNYVKRINGTFRKVKPMIDPFLISEKIYNSIQSNDEEYYRSLNKPPFIAQILHFLPKNKHNIIQNKTKNHIEFFKIIKELEQLNKHLNDMKYWNLSTYDLKEGILKIYCFHKEFVNIAQQFVGVSGENHADKCLHIAYMDVYDKIIELSWSLVDSYNIYLRTDTEELISYY